LCHNISIFAKDVDKQILTKLLVVVHAILI